jgi:hypothetical protein
MHCGATKEHRLRARKAMSREAKVSALGKQRLIVSGAFQNWDDFLKLGTHASLKN